MSGKKEKVLRKMAAAIASDKPVKTYKARVGTFHINYDFERKLEPNTITYRVEELPRNMVKYYKNAIKRNLAARKAKKGGKS